MRLSSLPLVPSVTAWLCKRFAAANDKALAYKTAPIDSSAKFIVKGRFGQEFWERLSVAERIELLHVSAIASSVRPSMIKCLEYQW